MNDAPSESHQAREDLDPGFWGPALTLQERIVSADEIDIDHQQANRRLSVWRSLPALSGPSSELDAKLRPVGIDQAHLYALLGERRENISVRLAKIPPWARVFLTAWNRSTSDAGRTWPRVDDFGAPIVFLVQDAIQTLQAQLSRFGRETGDLGDITHLLCRTVPIERLVSALRPALIQELELCRNAESLGGDSSEKRYAEFTERLNDRRFQADLWMKYPVLARYCTEILQQWVQNCLTFTRRLAADLADVRTHLCDANYPGQLTDISFGNGDSHCGGQTVARIDFEQDSVIYKPRSLRADGHIQALFMLFNEESPHALRCPRTVNRSTHGWAELIKPEAFRTMGEVRDFYWRFGAILALSYALRGTDLHYENIVATRHTPVLIDLETFFHPGTDAILSLYDGSASDDMLRRSVLSTGLLPASFSTAEDGTLQSVDASGLTGTVGQSPTRSWVVEGGGTDQMRLVERYATLAPGRNLPRDIFNVAADPVDYREKLLEGFDFAYRWLVQHRERLLAPGGFVERFAKAPMRLVSRHTSSYGRLLSQSFHPDFVTDALDRECSIARLCTGWKDVKAREQLIRHEMDALIAGDIPYMSYVPEHQDLLLDADAVASGVFDRKPSDGVCQQLRDLGERDRRSQLAIIESSIARRRTELDQFQRGCSYAESLHGQIYSDELVNTATRLGDRVADLLISDGDDITWLTRRLESQKNWVLAPIGLDIYDGLSGIGLFYSYLDRIGGLARHRKISRCVARKVVKEVRRLASAPEDSWPGSAPLEFAVASDVLLYLSHLGWSDARPPDIDDAVDVVLSVIDSGIETTDEFDFTLGLSGSILSLLAARVAFSDDRPLDLAKRAGDRLASCVSAAGMLTCNEPMGTLASKALAGVAHGASGIAVAMAKLHVAAPHSSYEAVVHNLLDYEDSLYDGDAENWPDLRADTSVRYRSAWCHGAAGIGLARCDLLRANFLHRRRSGLLRDIAVATKARMDCGPALRLIGREDQSLCHGDMGNLELLFTAERAGLRTSESSAFDSSLTLVVRSAQVGGWRCGGTGRVEEVGLFTGLAGIGYNLLRFACPELVPSILLKASPTNLDNNERVPR